jgi:hypothetical protein
MSTQVTQAATSPDAALEHGVKSFLLFAFVLICYCLPIIIAIKRKHPSAMGIGILDILLGWTFIGWIIALIWASSSTGNNHNINVTVNK